MWNYEKYEAGFSAGDDMLEDAMQRQVEDGLNMMGIWDAVKLGQELDGELDGPNLVDRDDTLLEELLESKEWYPYASKTMLLLDICDNLPRLTVSEALMRTFIWILRECGAKDVPSLDALRKTQKALRGQCSVPTIPCTSVQGKNFCIMIPVQ
ncbi:hypothetical protein R3P38DRAFT_3200915 [Favolaschia claudopus]|uniref:Uncharacterized protein n=1 Tax=Favolaschia claudopus TaxID=2862362 RepID=A0AAW0AZS9_9AGAR